MRTLLLSCLAVAVLGSAGCEESTTEVPMEDPAWTWSHEMEPGSTLAFQGIWGFADDAIWVVGSRGTVWRFDGSEWSEVHSAAFDDLGTLFDIWGSAGDDIWIVGSSGVILHFDGATWERLPFVTDDSLFVLWANAANDIFAGGMSGTILHYDGIEWSPHGDVGPQFVVGLWSSGPEDVYATTSEGVYRYDGSEWSQIIDDPSYEFNDVHGRAGDEVYIASYFGSAQTGNGRISRYSGESLIPMFVPNPNGDLYLYDDFALDASGTLWVSGGSGLVARLEAGSSQWALEETGVGVSLEALWTSPTGYVWAVGPQEAIVTTTRARLE